MAEGREMIWLALFDLAVVCIILVFLARGMLAANRVGREEERE